MTAPDLTKLTLAELRRIAIGDGTTADDPYAAVDELHRRAQANALVQAERDEFDEELHTCRAIVGATSEHLHVDLEELVDKLRRTEADSRSWQELATARAQANDALRAAADVAAKTMTTKSLKELRAVLAAAPAAPPTPAAPVTDAEIEAAIAAVNKALRWVGHSEDCASHENGPDTCDCGSDDDLRAAKDAVDLLRLMRSAPPAPAGDQDAKLRELRARLVDFCRIRDRGYDVRSDFSPLWVLDEIDRLLAAPAVRIAEMSKPAAKESEPARCAERVWASGDMEACGKPLPCSDHTKPEEEPDWTVTLAAQANVASVRADKARLLTLIVEGLCNLGREVRRGGAK